MYHGWKIDGKLGPQHKRLSILHFAGSVGPVSPYSYICLPTKSSLHRQIVLRISTVSFPGASQASGRDLGLIFPLFPSSIPPR